MNITEKILDLVQKALDELDNPSHQLSSVIRKAIRIARLRNDHENLWWLEFEMIFFKDNEAQKRIATEIRPNYSKEDFAKTIVQIIDSYKSERKCLSIDEKYKVVDKAHLLAQSVPSIEEEINYLLERAEGITIPKGSPANYELLLSRKQSALRTLANNYKDIFSRIKHRVFEFLTITEKQLLYGQLQSDIFERNRQYVDSKLKAIAPDALDQFVSVYRRMSEGDMEARSQALLSCRRILKSLADNLYPATEKPVVGPDGKERALTDDKYISRLWQFVAEKVKGTAAGDLSLAQINDFGSRIDRIYDLTCKGTHSEVSEFEVYQCVIQTYLLVGDILRIAEQASAIISE